MAPLWTVFYLDPSPLGYIPLYPSSRQTLPGWVGRIPRGNILANSMMQWHLTCERILSNNLPGNAKLYSNKCFLKSLKCIKIAAAGAPPQTMPGKLTAIQIPIMMYTYMWFGTEKRVRNLWVYWSSSWGCLAMSQSDLTGNNLANFVCNYQKFSIFE